MERIVRSAMGRCADFRRVRYITDHDRAVCGPHAEGVIQALAELIDNALVFSLHDSPVTVYVEKEISGVVITVEDAGMGMRHAELAHAEYLVSRPDDRTAWTGEAVGLAVVGMLADKHRLKVGFRPSSRGGLAAVLFVPAEIVTRPVERWPWSDEGKPGSEDEVPSDRRTAELAGMPPIPDGRTVLARERERERERERARDGGVATVPAPAPAPDPASDETQEVVVWGDLELPKRRRGATIGPEEWALMGTRPPQVEKEDRGEAFAAFMGPPGGAAGDDSEQPEASDGGSDDT
ncbi:ATP-binding protein [Actinomadura sp. CNU-125]|uniref:ATP-binding protein n=1 Tax=Actinomadura sp. CNU-125 TaxID=1904961 RepID=UPI00117804B3|nr:ATP-binding protein [Actinomadura sp. CNU-125]